MGEVGLGPILTNNRISYELISLSKNCRSQEQFLSIDAYSTCHIYLTKCIELGSLTPDLEQQLLELSLRK